MVWLTLLAEDAPATNLVDWVKVAAGGVTLTGIIWALIFILRQAWLAYAVNLRNDNARLRNDLDKRDTKIDGLYSEIRTKDSAYDTLEDEARELRYDNKRLIEDNTRLKEENARLYRGEQR